MNIKNIIIFLVVFLLVMWLQHNDDLKYGKERKELYDKIKLPLATSIMVLLIKDLNYEECSNIFQSVIILPQKISNFAETKNNVLNDIFIGPPDF
jgi:hypothetical protein